ncbi:hypothetical protein PRVXH_001420 [Proteinivorax hydrogeniformans]|uniref:Magnesium transporter MgtE intracellular domain-containing protein n=1 Tax=Proteinivorax hydrogeniformans TaxID=1826727 RepID=A0AAU8HP73_9FIRM
MAITAQKLKMFGYVVVIPLVLAFIIFVLISNALGLDLLPIPFLDLSVQDPAKEELEVIVAEKEEEIKSLESSVSLLSERYDELKESQNAKAKELELWEQDLKELEEQLVEKEEMLNDKKVRIETIADKYSNMRTRDAAAILQELDDDEIIAIFKFMDSDTVSDILSSFEPSRAASITKNMM